MSNIPQPKFMDLTRIQKLTEESPKMDSKSPDLTMHLEHKTMEDVETAYPVTGTTPEWAKRHNAERRISEAATNQRIQRLEGAQDVTNERVRLLATEFIDQMTAFNKKVIADDDRHESILNQITALKNGATFKTGGLNEIQKKQLSDARRTVVIGPVDTDGTADRNNIQLLSWTMNHVRNVFALDKDECADVLAKVQSVEKSNIPTFEEEKSFLNVILHKEADIDFFFNKVNRLTTQDYQVEICIPLFLLPLMKIVNTYTYVMRTNWKYDGSTQGRNREGYKSYVSWNNSFDGSEDDCPIVLRMRKKDSTGPFTTVGIDSVLGSMMEMWKNNKLDDVAKATLKKRSRETDNDEEEVEQLSKTPRTRALATIPALEYLKPFEENEEITFQDILKLKVNGITKVAPKLGGPNTLGKVMYQRAVTVNDVNCREKLMGDREREDERMNGLVFYIQWQICVDSSLIHKYECVECPNNCNMIWRWNNFNSDCITDETNKFVMREEYDDEEGRIEPKLAKTVTVTFDPVMYYLVVLPTIRKWELMGQLKTRDDVMISIRKQSINDQTIVYSVMEDRDRMRANLKLSLNSPTLIMEGSAGDARMGISKAVLLWILGIKSLLAEVSRGAADVVILARRRVEQNSQEVTCITCGMIGRGQLDRCDICKAQLHKAKEDCFAKYKRMKYCYECAISVSTMGVALRLPRPLRAVDGVMTYKRTVENPVPALYEQVLSEVRSVQPPDDHRVEQQLQLGEEGGGGGEEEQQVERPEAVEGQYRELQIETEKPGQNVLWRMGEVRVNGMWVRKLYCGVVMCEFEPILVNNENGNENAEACIDAVMIHAEAVHVPLIENFLPALPEARGDADHVHENPDLELEHPQEFQNIEGEDHVANDPQNIQVTVLKQEVAKLKVELEEQRKLNRIVTNRNHSLEYQAVANGAIAVAPLVQNTITINHAEGAQVYIDGKQVKVPEESGEDGRELADETAGDDDAPNGDQE